MGKRQSWALVAVVTAVAVVIGLLIWQSNSGAGAAPAPTTEVPRWSDYGAEVVGVRQGPDDHTVIVTVSMPQPRPECAREPRVEMLQDTEPDRPDTIYANIVYESTNTCTDRAKVDLPLRVSAPVGHRHFLFNSMQPAWGPAANGDYHACDELLGCTPPADHCDPAWIDKAVFSMDVPVKRIRGVREVLGCDGTWAVLDLNRAAGDCPPSDGVGPTCTVPPQTTRVFMHFGGQGWETIAGTKEAGCRVVHVARAEFPNALCVNLPALG